MLSLTANGAERLAQKLLSPLELERLQGVAFRDAGHGYDVFGAQASWVRMGWGLLKPMYQRWFRVSSSGAHNIPTSGGVILAANHSGTLPFDGLMLWCDVISQTQPPRLPRMVLDHFVPKLPFLSTFFSRGGAVGGSRENLRYLLEQGELVALFPEGVPGIGKSFWKRYKLQAWREGHVELAIRHRVPVVPVAIVGAEEQMPQLLKLPAPTGFGIPYIPLPLTPVPLPVHYHIIYGEPENLPQIYRPEQARDPQVLQEAAARIKARVQQLIDEGLQARDGVF